VFVEAPALGGAVLEGGAGVVTGDGDLDGVVDAGDLDWRGVLGGGAVAEGAAR
jgi:hypothetical protein